MNASSTSAKAAGSRSMSAMVCWINTRVMANHSFLVVDAGHSARPSRMEPLGQARSRILIFPPTIHCLHNSLSIRSQLIHIRPEAILHSLIHKKSLESVSTTYGVIKPRRHQKYKKYIKSARANLLEVHVQIGHSSHKCSAFSASPHQSALTLVQPIL